MSVFALSSGAYSDYHISYIFACRQDAERALELLNALPENIYETYSLEEWDLLPEGTSFVKIDTFHRTIELDFDGNVVNQSDALRSEVLPDCFHKVRRASTSITKNLQRKDDPRSKSYPVVKSHVATAYVDVGWIMNIDAPNLETLQKVTADRLTHLRYNLSNDTKILLGTIEETIE